MNDARYPTKRRLITVTDCSDIAAIELALALKQGLDEKGLSNDIDVAPIAAAANFSVANTAFSIRLLCEYCRPGDMILAVANATATSPERIFGTFGDGILFVGNNSGYFDWTFRERGILKVYENRLSRDQDGRPFGGKYVQVPTACELMSGRANDELGTPLPLDRLRKFDISDGTVVHIDNFGLIKMYLSRGATLSYNEGQRLRICVNGAFHSYAYFTRRMKQWPDGTTVLYRGSSLDGLPELACVRAVNTAKTLGISLHDVVSWDSSA